MERVHQLSEHGFLGCTCCVTAEEFLWAVCLFPGMFSCVVGAEYEVDTK